MSGSQNQTTMRERDGCDNTRCSKNKRLYTAWTRRWTWRRQQESFQKQ
jgi:hypothetical protein